MTAPLHNRSYEQHGSNCYLLELGSIYGELSWSGGEQRVCNLQDLQAAQKITVMDEKIIQFLNPSKVRISHTSEQPWLLNRCLMESDAVSKRRNVEAGQQLTVDMFCRCCHLGFWGHIPSVLCVWGLRRVLAPKSAVYTIVHKWKLLLAQCVQQSCFITGPLLWLL